MYFPGARTKAMIYYVSSYVEKKLHLVTGTSDLKSVNSPEEIANETISLVLFVKEKAHQIAVSLIVPRGDRFTKTAKNVNDCLEVEILQLRAKFQTATVSCSRFIWITNSSDYRRL